MAKTSSDELYKLIKSLSKREKIYFKVHLKSVDGTVPVYMQLFDFIDNQKQNDDALILKRFKGLNIQRLSAQKKYLHDKILEQISFLNNGPVKIISDLLVKADMLYDKALYRQSNALIKEAKMLAVKLELFPELLIILDFERKLIVNITPDTAVLEKNYRDNFNEKKTTLKNIADLETYQQLNDKIFISHFSQSRLRDNAHLKELKKYVKHPLLNIIPGDLSLKVKGLIYSTKSILLASLNDYKNSYKWSREKLNVTEQLTERGLYYTENYIKTLANYILACFYVKNYKEALQAIEKLKQVKAVEKTLDGIKNDYVYTNTIFLHLATFQYSKIILLEKEVESVFARFGDIINNKRRSVICFYMAFAYFCGSDFAGSKKWALKIINEVRDSEAKEFVSAARVLLLFVYYESEELNFMQSLVKNIYRFFKTRDHLYKTEKLLLAFMKKDIYKINSREEEKRAFLTLKARLAEIIKDPLEQNFLKIFDILSWIDSKIEDRSLAEVLKRKK
ncbi:MAG: hypothetical protein HYU69_01690 [Bacteroidetes bacterium]|nr:hypothetical protein [Bacteroidota bacterium]